MGLQLGDFAVDEATVPQPLPEVPAEAGNTVEEAELEEIADAEVGKGAETGRGSEIFTISLSAQITKNRSTHKFVMRLHPAIKPTSRAIKKTALDKKQIKQL